MNVLALIFISLFSVSAFADTPAFDNISESDLEKIVEDFSAVFHYSPVSGASSLGKIFGLEFGLIAGIAETPGVEGLVHEVDPSNDVEMLPSAGLYAAISVPMGVTIEASFLPEKEFEDVDLKYTSIGARWTLTDTPFLELPLNLAVRGSLTKARLGFVQDVNGVDADVTLETEMLSAGVVASKNFLIAEPYFGVNYVKADGEMSISGNNTFFDFGGQSGSSDRSGAHIYGGVNINLLLLNIGAEVGKVFESTKYSAKISFKF